MSATTRPPRSAATSPAASCFSCPSGFAAETPSTFQLSGRSAASDMSVIRSMSSSVKPVRQPGMISSSCRARMARAPQPPARAARRAMRCATAPGGRRRRCACAPATSRSPARRPPAQSSSSAAISSICSVGGVAADRVVAHHRQPDRRVPDEEAGVDGDPAVERVQVVAERRPVPGEARLRSAGSGMPSTRAIIRVR